MESIVVEKLKQLPPEYHKEVIHSKTKKET